MNTLTGKTSIVRLTDRAPCLKLSLHASESCDGHAIYIFLAMIEKKSHVYHVFAVWHNVISLESRPLIFTYSYTPTQSIQKQIVKYAVKSKYPGPGS